MMNKRKLGRGLQALLGGADDDVADTILLPRTSESLDLPIDRLEPNPYQPRKAFPAEELAGLTQSIHLHGILQPILVRQKDDRYQIVAGERRFRAAQEAGLSHVPVRVLPLDEQQTFELALVENLQREDLNPLDKAHAFENYLARFGTTHEELATHLGIDRSTVTNFIRLLELPGAVQDALRVGQITNGHARAMLTINDPVEQIALCRRIVAEALSVRQTEELARGLRPAEPAKPARPSPGAKSNHIRSLEDELRQRLGTKVEIRPKAKDKGFIAIHFESHDDFERVLGALRGSA